MYKFETAWNQNIEKGGTPIAKEMTQPFLIWLARYAWLQLDVLR
jgi:hypothetical protein